MMRISRSSLINGLQKVGLSFKKHIKNISSTLVHIGSVTNTSINLSATKKFFNKQNQTNTVEMQNPTKHNLDSDGIQARSNNRTAKIEATVPPSTKRRAPLPLLTPDLISLLEKTIEQDKQPTDWYTHLSPRKVR